MTTVIVEYNKLVMTVHYKCQSCHTCILYIVCHHRIPGVVISPTYTCNCITCMCQAQSLGKGSSATAWRSLPSGTTLPMLFHQNTSINDSEIIHKTRNLQRRK